MLLIDYSQVALANIFQFQSDLKKDSSSPDAINIIRHAVLTGIKSYKKKYGSEYGEVVIACDGTQYWRRDIFPYYKAGRKKAREKSDLDWKLIFNTISDIRDDLSQHFPYKVLHFNHIEADDIIAVLSKWTQTNGMMDLGMFEEKQPTMIISSDGDFIQLHKYDNVRQWNPMMKKLVKNGDPKSALLEKIATGDAGDGIPGVLSDDAVLVTEGARQKPLVKARREEFTKTGRDACRTDQERRNWDRNNALINFEQIPENISSTIVNTYNSVKPQTDKMAIYNYLVKHRCRLLLDELESF